MKVTYSLSSWGEEDLLLDPIPLSIMSHAAVNRPFLSLRTSTFIYNTFYIPDGKIEGLPIENFRGALNLAVELEKELEDPSWLKGRIDKMPRKKVERFISWLYMQHEVYIQQLYPDRYSFPGTDSYNYN